MLKSKYVLICFLLLFIPSLAFGLNIDADSNDATDILYGGTNSALTDPGADRLMFWDDGEALGSNVGWLTLGSGLAISTTTLNLVLLDYLGAAYDTEAELLALFAAKYSIADLDLTDFVTQTAWQIFYSDTNGDVTELTVGAANTVLKFNGVTSAPTAGALVDADIPASIDPDKIGTDGTANNKIEPANLNITSLDITATDKYILMGNVSNQAAPVAVSGAVTVSANTGVFRQSSQTPIAGTAAGFAAGFTGESLYGGTYRITTAGTAALPDPAVDMHFTILTEVAGSTTLASLATGTADTFYRNGLAMASDEDLIAAEIGAMCVFQYQAADIWMATCNGFAEVTPP